MLFQVFIFIYLFSNQTILCSQYDIFGVIELVKQKKQLKMDSRLESFFRNIKLVEITTDLQAATATLYIMSCNNDDSELYTMKVYGVSLLELEQSKKPSDL